MIGAAHTAGGSPLTDSPSPPKLAVVVVNYASHEDVATNLATISNSSLVHSVVIVDNHSSNEETAAITAVCEENGWTLLASPTNLGFGGGMNAGVARARELGCSTFLLINPDATIDEQALARLVDGSSAEPMTVFSPRVVRPDGSRWFDGGTVLVEYGRTSTAVGSDSSAARGWLSGACLLVTSKLWDLVGGFDDTYFLYWEDVDLSWRCAAAGARLEVRWEVEAIHHVGGTQQGSGKSTAYVYYNCRNRLLFAARHLSRRQQLRWVSHSFGYAGAVLQRGGRRNLLRRAVPLVCAAIAGTGSGIASLLGTSLGGESRRRTGFIME